MLTRRRGAAQVSLPGYAYFMGQKAEKNLLKSSLATTVGLQLSLSRTDLDARRSLKRGAC